VSSATFSPDGFRVVTASMDKTARVWDAAAGKSLATFSGYSRDLRSAVFSPDSLRVVITSDDGTTFVWQEDLWAPRSKQLELLDTGRELTSDERRTYLHE